jgi:hypothetical protein
LFRVRRRSRESPRETGTRTKYQNIWIVYLPCLSPSTDTTVIIVRHLLEVVPSRLQISASPRRRFSERSSNAGSPLRTAPNHLAKFIMNVSPNTKWRVTYDVGDS